MANVFIEQLEWQPLVLQVLDWLGSGAVSNGLDVIYRSLQTVKLFTKAVRKSIALSVEEGLKYLNEVQKFLVKECRANKEVMTAIANILHGKSIARSSMMKTALKTTIKANPLDIAVNTGQAVLELAGYKEKGKSFGLIGNIGTGMYSGFMVGGLAGAGVGALVGFSTWVLGEAVDDIVHWTKHYSVSIFVCM